MGKKAKPPPPPDYTALAKQTADSANAAAEANTRANRPNQTDVYGNTSTWSEDAAGNWTQNQKLGESGQRQLDTGNALSEQLSGQVSDALKNPYSTEGLPELSNYDPSKLQDVDANGLRSKAGMFNMDPTGNSQAIQDATYKLLQPQRDQARASELQRLKNQGLTEDSPAFQRAMQRQGDEDTSAQLRSLLAGQTEYGNAFNRGLDANKSNFDQSYKSEDFARALRGDQWNEQGDQAKMNMGLREYGLNEQKFMRESPLNELEQMKRINAQYNPQFGNFMGATAGQGTDYYGAAKDKYGADVAQVNAANASKSALTSGLMTMAGTVMGGPVGGMIGSALGGAVSGGAKKT